MKSKKLVPQFFSFDPFRIMNYISNYQAITVSRIRLGGISGIDGTLPIHLYGTFRLDYDAQEDDS